jgi:hypothetical protein
MPLDEEKPPSSTFNTVRICEVGAKLAPFNTWSLKFSIILIFVKHTTLAPSLKRTATSAGDVPLLYSQTKRYSRNSLKLDFHLNFKGVLQQFTCTLISSSLPNLPAPYISISSSISFLVCSNLQTASPQYPITTILKPPQLPKEPNVQQNARRRPNCLVLWVRTEMATRASMQH